jgi:hypothetical protein
MPDIKPISTITKTKTKQRGHRGSVNILNKNMTKGPSVIENKDLMSSHELPLSPGLEKEDHLNSFVNEFENVLNKGGNKNNQHFLESFIEFENQHLKSFHYQENAYGEREK